MDFFGLGMGEVLLILIIALIVWGPGRIPEVARTIGRAMRVLRKASFDLTSQITKELDAEERAGSKRKALPDSTTENPAGMETTSPAGEASAGNER